MNALNIQQGNTIETVSLDIIKKLYNAAISVPEPQNGETDAAYLSGHIQANNSYREWVEYLAGTIGEGGNGTVTSIKQNAEGRFQDLTIDIVNSYYIKFEDPEVQRVLSLYYGDGVGISEQEALTVGGNSNNGYLFSGNQTIKTFPEYPLFTNLNNTGSCSFYNSTLESIDLSEARIIPRLERSNVSIDLNVPNATGFIGDRCCYHAVNIKSIVNLGRVTEIPAGAFAQTFNCFGKVNLPFTCTSIRRGAFSECKTRESIDLQYITYIENNAFYDCSNLPYVENYNLTYVPDNCFDSNNMQTFDFSNIQTIGRYSFEGKTTQQFNGMTLSIPNLTSIDVGAFRRTGITSISNLGSITTIPNECFKDDTALHTVKIPYECTNIIGSAFQGCSSLTSITQYNKSLDDYAEGESPTFTNISRITSFGQSCFDGCSLLSLTSQDIQNATTIGNKAFMGTLLSGDLNLSNLTGRIGVSAFNGLNISSISSLGNVTEIGESAFGNTNISSITIPNTVKKCACSFVSNTVVPEIIFPEGVEQIPGGQFYTKNNSLTYIEIPSTVTNMGNFFHRTLEHSQDNLCTLIIKATTPPELKYYTSGGNPLPDSTRCGGFSGIYVPDASLTAYQNAANAWQHSSIQAKLKPISQLQTDNPTAWAKYNRV